MNVYEIITNKIIEALENGTVPWRKPWVNVGPPKNLASKTNYNGINVLMLSLTREANGYKSNYWLTYNQAKKLGGQVKKGSKGTPVIYWKFLEYDDADKSKSMKRIPFLRYYTVFNVAQVDGVEIPKQEQEKQFVPLGHAEEIINNVPNKPDIQYGSEKASYSPNADVISLPHKTQFHSSEEYYSTYFHEMVHATGHKDRLNRPTVLDAAPFGSENYSKEELVAEIGSAFLSGHANISPATIQNSQAYIRGWLSRLRGDTKLVVFASAQAQKASDYILNKKKEEVR